MSLREYIEARSVPIPFSGCWLWLLSYGSHGYGQGTGNGARVTVAHRLSFDAYKGPIPAGMLVQHSCDNKWCVNPDHLALGTDATNALDKQRKGRAAKKLDARDIVAIRYCLQAGDSYAAISRVFDVHDSLIRNIHLGHVWRHVA